MADDYKIWMRRAKSCLAISKIKSDEDIVLEDLCFQAQQAVEKALKGLLVFYAVEPEKTHNLVSLIKELSQLIDIPEEIDETAILSDYAVQTRYPGNYSPVEEDEYHTAIITAEKCVKWIDKHIKEGLKKMEGEKIQPYLENLV